MKRIVAAFVLGICAVSANAAFMSHDLFAEGDGLLTYDTVSGLEWLDESGLPSLTWTQLLDGAGGWRHLGFRFADSIEIDQFLLNAGVTKISWVRTSTQVDASTANAHEVLSALGISDSLASPIFTNVSQGTTTTSSSNGQIGSYGDLFWDYTFGDEISWDGPFFLRYLEQPGGGGYVYEWESSGTDPGCQFVIGAENDPGCHQWNSMLVRVAAAPVPIPASAYLFASALGFLGWMRRRKK